MVWGGRCVGGLGFRVWGNASIGVQGFGFRRLGDPGLNLTSAQATSVSVLRVLPIL